MAKNNLGEYLLNDGKSQAELSRECGISITTISKAVNQKGISPKTMVNLTKGLNSLCRTNYEVTDVFPSFTSIKKKW